MKIKAPSLGQMVHYIAPRTNGPVMAAIIIGVKNEHNDEKETGLVDLNVFHPFSGGGHLVPGVRFSRTPKDEHWFWPESVADIEVVADGKSYEMPKVAGEEKPCPVAGAKEVVHHKVEPVKGKR